MGVLGGLLGPDGPFQGRVALTERFSHFVLGLVSSGLDLLLRLLAGLFGLRLGLLDLLLGVSTGGRDRHFGFVAGSFGLFASLLLDFLLALQGVVAFGARGFGLPGGFFRGGGRVLGSGFGRGSGLFGLAPLLLGFGQGLLGLGDAVRGFGLGRLHLGFGGAGVGDGVQFLDRAAHVPGQLFGEQAVLAQQFFGAHAGSGEFTGSGGGFRVGLVGLAALAFFPRTPPGVLGKIAVLGRATGPVAAHHWPGTAGELAYLGGGVVSVVVGRLLAHARTLPISLFRWCHRSAVSAAHERALHRGHLPVVGVWWGLQVGSCCGEACGLEANVSAGLPSDSARMAPGPSRSVWAGVLIGVGIAAFVDETVFHQILHWHHFYDRATLEAGLVSDGFFHAFGWFATVIGLVVVADVRRRSELRGQALVAGILLGTGAFQLYDGTVHHKLLRLHQIRYHVDLLPYDWTWNGLAVLMLVGGGGLLWRVLGRRRLSR